MAGSEEYLKLRVVHFKEFLLAFEQTFAPSAGICRTNTKFALHYGTANAHPLLQLLQLDKRGDLLMEHETEDCI